MLILILVSTSYRIHYTRISTSRSLKQNQKQTGPEESLEVRIYKASRKQCVIILSSMRVTDNSDLRTPVCQ